MGRRKCGKITLNRYGSETLVAVAQTWMEAQRYGACLHQQPCLSAVAIFSPAGMLGTAPTAENQDGMKALTLYRLVGCSCNTAHLAVRSKRILSVKKTLCTTGAVGQHSSDKNTIKGTGIWNAPRSKTMTALFKKIVPKRWLDDDFIMDEMLPNKGQRLLDITNTCW